MYFEAKDKGGIDSEKVKVDKNDKEKQEARLREYADRFKCLKALKTKGGNN